MTAATATTTRPPALPPTTGGGTAATRRGAVGETTVRLGAPGRSHIQPPLLAVVRAGTCRVTTCDRTADHLTGGRHGYCCAHTSRLRARGRVDAHVPIATPPAGVPDVPLTDEVDEVAVGRVMSGWRMSLSRAEIRYAVAVMSNRGMTAAQIAEVLAVSPRTVVRWRGRIRVAS